MGESVMDEALAERIRKLWDEQRRLHELASRRGLSGLENRRLDELRQALRELWQREREQRGTNVPPQ